jgi:hypothetical protein
MQKLPGWHTTEVSKPMMCNALHAALVNGEIGLNNLQTLVELRGFQSIETRGGAIKLQGLPHDDRVMSLAIAHQMRQWILTKPVDEEPAGSTFFDMTFDEWASKLGNEEDREILVIGGR